MSHGLRIPKGAAKSYARVKTLLRAQRPKIFGGPFHIAFSRENCSFSHSLCLATSWCSHTKMVTNMSTNRQHRVGFCPGDNDHIHTSRSKLYSSHNEKSATGHFCFSEFRAAATLPQTHIPSQGMTTASYYFRQHTQLQQHPGTSLSNTRAARQPSNALKEPSKRALKASRAGKDMRAHHQRAIKDPMP